MAQKNIKRFLRKMDLDSMKNILSIDPRENKCSCAKKENQSRCEHKFTWEQIWRVRGDWYSSSTAEQDMIIALQQHNPALGAPVEPDGTPEPHKHIQYFLCNKPVCRPFFMKCLNVDHRVCDHLSKAVQGHVVVKKARNQRPRYDTVMKQFEVCVSFLNTFFGEQCQMSDPEHRYFPVNLSLFHIYYNIFYPWWKDVMGHWKDSQEPTEAPPLSDVPIVVEGPTVDITSLFEDSDASMDEKHVSDTEKEDAPRNIPEDTDSDSEDDDELNDMGAPE